MRELKILGSALIGCAALFAFTASAQTQNVPVACNWVHTGSQAGQSAAIITFQCKESNGNVAATRSLTYSAPSWQVTYCTISLASGVLNSGTCQNASLYRVVSVVVPPPSSSSNSSASTCFSGQVLGQACLYSQGPWGSYLTPTPNPMACGGSSCVVDTTEKGYNDTCRPGSSAQQYNNPIVEFSCR